MWSGTESYVSLSCVLCLFNCELKVKFGRTHHKAVASRTHYLTKQDGCSAEWKRMWIEVKTISLFQTPDMNYIYSHGTFLLISDET